MYTIELIYKISLELHTQTYFSPTNNTTSKPSTEKANSFRNKAQEKQTHYFKRSLTPNPHVPHEQNSCASACNTSTTQNQPHQISNTQRTENKTTDVVIQQHSRKLLKMDILMSETCWAHKKWKKTASDIKLVFHSSTITMTHGPINVRLTEHVLCNVNFITLNNDTVITENLPTTKPQGI